MKLKIRDSKTKIYPIKRSEDRIAEIKIKQKNSQHNKFDGKVNLFLYLQPQIKQNNSNISIQEVKKALPISFRVHQKRNSPQ